MKNNYCSGKSFEILCHLKPIPGIILYPSLLTPEILVGDDWLEILLLCHEPKEPKETEDNYSILLSNSKYVIYAAKYKKPSAIPDLRLPPIPKIFWYINHQLKISQGLNKEKIYNNEPLFESIEDIFNNIKFDQIEEWDNDTILKTDNRFSGLLDKRFYSFLKEEGKKEGNWNLYKIKINIKRIINVDKGMYTILWASKEQVDVNNNKACSVHTLNKKIIENEKIKIVPDEKQDCIIKNGLKMHGQKIKEAGNYCFKIKGKDVDITEMDFTNPIQYYHPVFYYKELKYANLSHMADLHISSRQILLSKSKAKVIECTEDECNSDIGIYPEIGTMVNVCTANVKNLLDQIGRNKEIHILIIGGDIVDFIKNMYLGNDKYNETTYNNMTVGDIWQIVGLGNKYEDYYQDFIDFISFYSLIIYFYEQYEKPAFIVSGNHDAYPEPYGISPRVPSQNYDFLKANKGIPADHNLTFYEATLIFGDTYGEVKLKHQMDSEYFKWFFSVLTPFSDFTVHLPNQSLIGLSWGNNEDLIWDSAEPVIIGLGVGGVPGALIGGQMINDECYIHAPPKSGDAISKVQLEFIKDALNGNNRKIFLISHFTYISYDDTIPLFQDTNENNHGKIKTIDKNFTKYEIGTFKTNRENFYRECAKNIHYILTGHTHRRGLYTITEQSQDLYQTKFYDFNDFEKCKGKNLIIVCDSAGPLPRHNRKGEFKGFGSDRSSATKLIFEEDGSIKQIDTIQTGYKPRIAVVLDYVDVECDCKMFYFKRVEEKTDLYSLFISNSPIIKNSTRIKKWSITSSVQEYKSSDTPIFFELCIDKEISKYIDVEKVVMYQYIIDQERRRWIKSEFKNINDNFWYLEKKDKSNFLIYFNNSEQKEGKFMAVKLRANNQESSWLKKYDFDSWWIFEFEIDSLFDSYIIKRNKIADKPDFEWRKKMFPEKYNVTTIGLNQCSVSG